MIQYSVKNKAKVRIVTVDPTTRRIEAALKDRAIIQISIYETGSYFRWPKQGELWTVKREGVDWFLDKYVEEGHDIFNIEELGEGEAKIAADVIKTQSGYTLLTSNDSIPLANQEVFIQHTAPAVHPLTYIWIQTGLGTGSDFSFFFEDGT